MTITARSRAAANILAKIRAPSKEKPNDRRPTIRSRAAQGV